MTTQREATWWMVAAMAVVVYACLGTGCQASRPLQAISPTITPADHATARTGTPPATFTSDDVAPITMSGGDEPSHAATFRAQQRSFSSVPRALSLATPWHTAQELITSAITRFHAYPPETVQVSSRPGVMPDADHASQPGPLYEPLTLARVGDEDAAAFWNLSLARDTWIPTSPRPDLGALRMRQTAKFDGGGWVFTVLGAMVLLFGGEAVVLWIVVRKPEALPVGYTTHAADDWADFAMPYSIAPGSPDLTRHAA